MTWAVMITPRLSNSAGQQQWARRYDGQRTPMTQPRPFPLMVGKVYVTGGSYGSGLALIMPRSNTTDPGNNNGFAATMALRILMTKPRPLPLMVPTNVYVTGESYGSGSNYDYATIKYDTSGQQQWVRRYEGSANYDDQATAIAVEGSGSVYVTGRSYDSGSNYDYATIKYVQGVTLPYDFNHDNKPDFVLYNGSAHQTAVWLLGTTFISAGRSDRFCRLAGV